MERSSNSSGLMNILSLCLELPIELSDATQRGIDSELCKLLVRFKDKDFSAVSRLLVALCPVDRSIYMTSVGEFASLGEILPRLTDQGDAVSATDQFVRLRDAEAIKSFLSLWKAEALIVFFANDKTAGIFKSAVGQSQPKWWKLSKSGCEAPFLAQISLTDSVLFFSEDHMSLEALGTKPSILEFFDCVRTQELS
jgi:hypothetical protein